jgi:hypothetical protein
MEDEMSRLIDRIKDSCKARATKHQEQTHDHESGAAHGHADEQAQVGPQPATHERPAEPEHDKKGHKHC